ncbi:hypothetical protein BQ8482_100204 [Mesorhizobium delmotii]|uniref:Uncharacterized protein n=2 Tax=Mesorhizobium delmotii TaxID=1631247 RepID=A0A2P9AA68_9HYPH|nr:hypothetical protein BQ8482_100204 [Mesorhizobium delmotii]
MVPSNQVVSATQPYRRTSMTAATPLARYSAVEGALASGFATADLHHAVGHDRLAGKAEDDRLAVCTAAVSTGTAQMHRTFRRILATMLIAWGVGYAAGYAQAQNPLIITAPVSGQTIDGTLSFSGTAAVNSITRRGTIRGQTNTGVECRGTTTINLTFSRGEGTMVCGQLSTRFVFSLTSRQPPAGTGTGILSDGRKVVLRIGR